MPKTTLVGRDTAGGLELGGGNSFVTDDGALIAVLGDRVAPHANRGSHSGTIVMVSASSFVTINGIPICRAGDSASCGHTSTGSGIIDSE